MHAMDTIVMVLNQIRRWNQYFGLRIGMDGMFFVMQSSDNALLLSKKCFLEVFVSRPMYQLALIVMLIGIWTKWVC